MEPSIENGSGQLNAPVDLSRASENAPIERGETGPTKPSGSKSRKTNRRKPIEKENDGYDNVERSPDIIPAAERSPMSKETVESAIASLVNIIDESVQRAIRGSAADIKNEPEFVKTYVDKVSVTSDEKEQFKKLGAEICEQYGLLGKHAVLMFFAVFAIGYITRITLTKMSLNNLMAEKKKLGITDSDLPKQKDELRA
jgi:hypothetical protein